MKLRKLELTSMINPHVGRVISTVLLTIWLLASAAAQENVARSAPPSAKQIVAQMVSHNQRRAEELRSYTSTRDYHLVYAGFPSKREAEIVVSACYEAPSKKEFTIVSQTGSSFMVSRVLKRLLESEQEATTDEQKARTELSERNYDFELLGQETVKERPAYILRVIPKVDNKFLYRGRVWVDANDFAVIKIEAEPAKRPSFWISKTKINHSYAKIGEFWLPAENKSTTDVRLGGVATLTISYTNYEINQNRTASSCSIGSERKLAAASN
jgi:Tfp pilus assembly protein PilV